MRILRHVHFYFNIVKKYIYKKYVLHAVFGLQLLVVEYNIRFKFIRSLIMTTNNLLNI